MTQEEPLITASARRHGVPDEVILHALRNAIDHIPLDEGRVMHIGAGPNGALYEVGTIRDGAVVIHAMPARTKFLR